MHDDRGKEVLGRLTSRRGRPDRDPGLESDFEPLKNG